MAEFDVVLRNGSVVDGTGGPSTIADVAILDGRIAWVGRVSGSGREEFDVEDLAVTPGFIDGHTHFDAQMFWDPFATSSCWHGVTTVVHGNCGFTLAPVRAGEHDLVLRNLERAEDIPAAALTEGVQPWTWEHFAEYLDVVDGLPKAVNVAAYIGHSALRTWAMGERAFDSASTPDDIETMAEEVRAARAAGAIGFTTSRSGKHMTADDRPVASRLAAWSEVVALVGELGRAGGGVFEIANESAMSSSDPAIRAEAMGRLRDLAMTPGITTTFGVTSFDNPDRWLEQLDLLATTAARGGRMFGQTSGRESDVLFTFHSRMPFDRVPEWKSFRSQPVGEQLEMLRDGATRRRLAKAARAATAPPWGSAPGGVDLSRFRVFDHPDRPNPTLLDAASDAGVDPVDFMLDRAVETGLEQLFSMVIGNADPDEVETIMKHPHTVMTFSDSGAHVGIGINASLPTHLLSFWVRQCEAIPFEAAIHMLTQVPAEVWGFADRGVVRPGCWADVNVIDPSVVGPRLPTVETDLPGGGRRFTQRANGIRMSLVAGEVILRDGERTGRLPGRLVRARTSA